MGPACLGHPLGWTPPPLSPLGLSPSVPLAEPTLPSLELPDQAQRSRRVRDLVRSLPAPNHDTLRLLFQHLCR